MNGFNRSSTPAPNKNPATKPDMPKSRPGLPSNEK